MAPSRKDLITAFENAGYELWLVGGAVRDNLRGVSVDRRDYDYATSALPDSIITICESFRARTVTIGKRFGTIGIETDEGWCEVTTFRGESYCPGDRHPDVSFGHTIHEDLARRDFTINAIAENTITGERLDPFDGLADLSKKIIRTVGEPKERYQEDPLRILRGVRFVSELGFALEPTTQAGMTSTVESLRSLSQERITAELERLLVGSYPEQGLNLLSAIGALPIILPELAGMPDCEQNRFHQFDVWGHTVATVASIDCQENRRLRRWVALMHDLGKPSVRHVKKNGEWGFYRHEIVGAELTEELTQRLRLSKQDINTISLLVRRHMDRPTLNDARLVRRFMNRLDGHWRDMVALKRADNASHTYDDDEYHDGLEIACRRIEEEDSAALRAESPLDGHELMEICGRKPGFWIGRVKDRLSEMVLDGEIEPGDKGSATRIALQMFGPDRDSEGES